ncbi:hypothetical protein SAMN05216370_0018 [Pseudomonas peli]|uniref:Uncharacterized protein n=1 Tax=Pseudomonas peli TaxID=592361 RepID=A0A1G4U6H5_9PSED|nr:hypothetical protein [Pseudomonas peli]NMZ71336.1 hypothetical protein [Pseudomonas peli]NMZ71392.1 hypothetical protein [Pseudomonas peli]SCW89253.1 hypothetical protein SAMN05216370_0018 [Pseudomonas peli]
MASKDLVRSQLARNLAKAYAAELLEQDDGLANHLQGEPLTAAERREAKAELQRIASKIRAGLPPDLI